jgi:uncharacterized protein DUF4440
MTRHLGIWLAIGALSIVGAVAAGQQARWAGPDDETAKAMISMERKWAEADCDGNLSAETTLADDFEGTAPDGKRYAKSDDIQGAKTAKERSLECRLGEVKVHYFGETVAVLYGSESRVEKGKDGKDHTLGLIWTDTWLKRNGKWQIIAAQDNWAEKK